MWPYCGLREHLLPDPDDPRHDLWDWECIRGCALGVASVFVFVVGLYATIKIGIVFFRTRWYGLNMLMLTLATLQSFLTSIKYILVREQRLTFAAAYLRGLQTLLTCANYAKSAITHDRNPEQFAKYYFTILGIFVFYLTALFLFALALDVEGHCFHPRWILMSVSQFVIVCLFSVPGWTVMKQLTGAMNLRYEYFDLMNGDQQVVSQQRHGLRVLLLINGTGAVAQLFLDTWLQLVYEDEEQCIIFESGFEEIMRIFLKILSYDLPVLATVYVYYWLPRRQFDTGLDIELPVGNGDLGLDEAFSTELLES